MRIAVWHNLPSGGAKRALYDHLRGLQSRGHDIEAWCPPTADLTYLPLAEIMPEHVVDLKPWEARDWRHPVEALRRQSWKLVDSMEAHCRAVGREINAGGFDLLFAATCQHFAASPIARHVDLPSAIYQQEPYRRRYEAGPELIWLASPRSDKPWYSPSRLKTALRDHVRLSANAMMARQEYENVKAFDKILVNSIFSRENVTRVYGLPSEVCYLSVDASRFQNRSLPKEGFVVGLGAILPSKNVELAVRAMGRLKGKKPELIWIGNMADPVYSARVVALAESLGVPFRPLVRVSDEELVDLLNRASAMIYTPRLEPFGLAPVEGALCGVPVVAVAEGGCRETVVDGRTGFLTEPDPDLLAEALQRLIDDPDLARRMGDAGAEWAREVWSFAAGTDRVEEKLLSLVRE